MQQPYLTSWTEWHCSHKQTVHELNYDTAVTNRLFMDWMTLQSQTDCSWTEWHCGQTDCSWTEWHCSHKLFMDWMTLQSQSSWTEWRCGHKQNAHGLNYDTAVTNRLFMDWMTLQSQTEFVDWMTLQSQTDCSWTEWHCSHKQSSLTEWHCSHKQTVYGLTNAAATSNFMDWMTFPKHILSVTHKIWDPRFSQQYC